MKKTLLSCCFFTAAIFSLAQPCSDVFISEYVEGWSNNKAIEIYNPTESPIDVSGYGLVRFQNGDTEFGEISYLTGVTIQPGQAFVVVLDKQDPNGTGLEAPVWDELLEAADLFINPNYDNGIWPMYFNGNDAVALVKNNGSTLVDLFGKIGEGAGFGGWGAYGTDGEGNQLYISQDHTLVRKESVNQGVTANPSSFDITAQWDSLPANTFDHLGWHESVCIVSVEENTSEASVRVYPNPVQGDFISIVAEEEIQSIRLVDVTGKLLAEEIMGVHDIMYRADVTHLQHGVFVVEVTMRNGKSFQQRILR